MKHKRFITVFAIVALACSFTATPSQAEPTAISWLPAMLVAPGQCSPQPVTPSQAEPITSGWLPAMFAAPGQCSPQVVTRSQAEPIQMGWLPAMLVAPGQCSPQPVTRSQAEPIVMEWLPAMFAAPGQCSPQTVTPSQAEPTASNWLPAMLVAPGQCTCPPVVASGLRTPVKLIFTQHGNLLVAEAGNGTNTGRISVVDPATGQRRTLIDGLPSGLVGTNSPVSGPSGLSMRGRTLFMTIGSGDSTLPGAGINTRVPNPNPSSPIFSSVLAIDFTPHVEKTTTGFNLTYADQHALQSGAEVTLTDGAGGEIRVRLVANFPDHTSEPRKDEPNNVRPSDPFGLVISANHLYVVDSDSNLVRQIDMQTGEVTTLTEFAPVSSGLTDANAVPVSIRFFGDQLLVSLLTSDPFPTNAAQVRIVDPATGSEEPFITGLTTAIDVLPIRGRGRATDFLTLELSADMQAGKPGRLRRYASPEAAPVVVADCLNLPTSMARDEQTGDLFVTEIFTGRIVKVAAP